MSLLNSTQALGLAVLVVVSAKTLAWLLQLRLKNAGLVDPIWAWTLGFLAVLYAVLGSAPVLLKLVLAAMGGFWGLRLGLHLFVRNWNQPEDWRYAKFRQEWGAKAAAGETVSERSDAGAGAGRSTASRTRCFASTVSAVDFKMFWFFQFQNIFTLLLSTTAFLPVAYRQDLPSLWAIVVALLIWNISVIGEGMADSQMERFRSNPANHGKVCRDGLWRYSRHPNYFFESLHWAAYIPLAIGAPYGWVSLAAPVIMSLLLMKLSGVPMLEAEMIRRKAGYADYVRSTSALIPWPPKRS